MNVLQRTDCARSRSGTNFHETEFENRERYANNEIEKIHDKVDVTFMKTKNGFFGVFLTLWCICFASIFSEEVRVRDVRQHCSWKFSSFNS